MQYKYFAPLPYRSWH